METFVIVIHVLACIFLIGAVMLQSGHEGMGVIFGGGSSTMFGSSGAGGLLVKITAGLATVFLVDFPWLQYPEWQQGLRRGIHHAEQ